MATVIQQPETLCFSSLLSDIVFGTSADKCTVTLTVTCGGESQTLIDEIMYPDAYSHITLVDLPPLIEPYARRFQQLALDCSIDDSTTTTSISTVHVVYCACEIGAPTDAAAFIAGHFLTLLDGRRFTAPGRGELLSAYGETYDQATHAQEVPSATFKVMAKVLDANGRLDVMTVTEQVVPCNTDGILQGQLLLYQFDASPRRMAALYGISEDRLLAYTVWMGLRSQDYVVVHDEKAPSPSLLFANSFGVGEILHCTGRHAKESKFDRKSARINGVLRHYAIREDRQFTAVTGWISDAMALWADELFRSYEVYLWTEKEGVGREVTVSDSKNILTNVDDDLTMYEFTYTYAQRNHNVKSLPYMYGRLHNEPFNTTFN